MYRNSLPLSNLDLELVCFSPLKLHIVTGQLYRLYSFKRKEGKYVIGDRNRPAGSWLIFLQEAGMFYDWKGGCDDYKFRIDLDFGKMLLWT